MSTSVMSIASNKIGTCPHGLPPGACPICNGMGGGGGGSAKKANEPRNPGEMTYAQCYAIGQMLKAQKMSKELDLKQAQMQSFAQNLNNLVSKLQTILTVIKNVLPQPIDKLFDKTVNKIITPLINIIKNIPQAIKELQNIIKDIRTQILAVMDKLTAILGELKQFVDANLKSTFKKLKKRIFSFLLFMQDGEDEEQEEENTRIIEFKELFKIKEMFRKSIEKTEKDDSDNE